MDTRQHNLKPAASVSLIALFILFIYSFIFYKERFFCDFSFIAFDVINYGKLQIQVERYGSFITQMVPLFLSRWHTPLKVVLVCYSISFTLFPLITALILFRLRQFDLVILMGLYFTLYVSDAFFWCNNELHQAITWMCLLYGVMRTTMNREHKPAIKILAMAPFAALAFLTIFTHPVVIIPFMFLWIFWWIDDKDFLFKSKVWPAVYLLVIMGILLIKLSTSSQNGYDSANINHLGKTSLQDVLDAFGSGMANSLWQGWISNYWFIPALFITSAIVLIRKRKYLLASWVVLTHLAFFVLICLTFSELSTFHLESEVLPFSIMASAAFIYYALPALSKKQMVFIMAVIFITRLTFISFSAEKFIARTEKIDQMVAYMEREKINKLIVKIDDRDKERDFIQSWSVPAESIYQGLLKGYRTPKTLILFNEKEVEENYAHVSFKTGILYPFAGFYPQRAINYSYFKMDTVSHYTLVHYEDIIRK